MTSSMDTVLIFGGTGGIGESFARSLHKMGKKIIITGRRESRLSQLATELPGLETYKLDNSDLAALPGHVRTLLARYPAIDTVWVNAGIQYTGDFRSPLDDSFSSSSDKITQELNVNLAAPMILARHCIPHLLSLPREANFLITSSGIAFVPFSLFPVYSASKAGVHAFLVSLRDQLRDTNVHVIELAPPYVRTDLDAAHRMDTAHAAPMELDDYTRQAFEVLQTPAGDIKEAAVGFAAMGAAAWRAAFTPFLNTLHSQG